MKLGADDYITKPFEAEELVLRIHNILRRSGKEDLQSVQLGNLHVRFNELVIESGEEQHAITPKESELLRYMISHPNTLLTREQILEDLWKQKGVWDLSLRFHPTPPDISSGNSIF